MQALSLNSGTRSLALGYCFSKCGEFAFEAAFAVTIVLITEADLLLIGVAYFFRYLPSMVFSPLAGWLADNADKKRTLLRSRRSNAFWHLPSLPCSVGSRRHCPCWWLSRWS